MNWMIDSIDGTVRGELAVSADRDISNELTVRADGRVSTESQLSANRGGPGELVITFPDDELIAVNRLPNDSYESFF